MAILISTHGAKKLTLFSRIAAKFSFRGRKRVAPHLERDRKLYVTSDGIRAKSPIERTTIFAAQLASLSIREIRISEDESASAVLDIIASAKTLPAGDDVTIADLDTRKGILTYIISPLSSPRRARFIFNNTRKSVRQDLVEKLPSTERIRYVANAAYHHKEQYVHLLTEAEKEEAGQQVMEKLKATSKPVGHTYVKVLHLLEKAKAPEAARIIEEYYNRSGKKKALDRSRA